MSFHWSEKTLTQHCSPLFPLFSIISIISIWLLGLEELLHNLSPRNEEKQYGCQIDQFSFLSSLLLTSVKHLFRQTNSLVAKGCYKGLKVKSRFDFTLQYRSIYATFKLVAHFSFASALKME